MTKKPSPIIARFPYKESANLIAEIASYFLQKQDQKLVFKLDDELKRMYRLLTLYFINDPEFEKHYLKVDGGKISYSLSKGILLIGPTGRSKTFCFEKVFKFFTSNYILEKKYRVINSNAIQLAFEVNGLRALNQFRKNDNNDYDNIYVDEIGIEEFSVQHYGNRQSPVSTFLHERHRLFTSSGYITHCTTNLKINSVTGEPNFRDAYGERNYSRLFEMFNIIIITGEDLRINIIPDK
jgi:DNA replication protein DnaC